MENPKRYTKARAVLEEKYKVFVLSKDGDPETLADQIKQQAHHDRVQGLVTEIKDEIASGRIMTAESMTRWLDELTVHNDGEALDILRYSKWDDAYFEHFGNEFPGDWCTVAVYALRAEVEHELKRDGIDTSDPAPYTLDCPKCGELPVDDEDDNTCKKCGWVKLEDREGYVIAAAGQCGGDEVCKDCLDPSEDPDDDCDEYSCTPIDEGKEFTCERCNETFKAVM